MSACARTSLRENTAGRGFHVYLINNEKQKGSPTVSRTPGCSCESLAPVNEASDANQVLTKFGANLKNPFELKKFFVNITGH